MDPQLPRPGPGAAHGSSPRRGSAWLAAAAVLAGGALVFGVLTPAKPWSHYPVHHDDFANLATVTWTEAAARIGLAPRPVSHVLLGFLSAAGLPAYFTALHLLTAAFVWLALCCAVLLFPGRRPGFAALCAAAAAAWSLPEAVEWLLYTGLITNQLSGVFGLAAIAILMRGEEQATPAPRRAAVCLLGAGSFFSKEDFVVPVLLVAAYLAWRAWAGNRALLRCRLATFGALLAAAVLVVLYNKAINSGYTQAAAGAYAPNFHPWSILRTASAYLTATPERQIALGLQAAALSWNWVAGSPVAWHRVWLWQGLIAAVLLPYACLPHHTAPYYALDWHALQTTGALVLLWALRPGWGSAAAAAAIAAALVAAPYARRQGIAHWYAQMGEQNRRIVALLEGQRAALAPYPTVAVEGAPATGPWFGSDGLFLARRHGLDHAWVVLIPAGGEYQRLLSGLLAPEQVARLGRVMHRETGRDPLPPGVPVVRLAPGGGGTVEWPRPAIP